MTNEHALFLKVFNPCADRVDAIQAALHQSLDEQAAQELINHVETCKRCRRYQGYLESVEKGFRKLPADIAEVSPLAAAELPSALQEEMAQAMKRNLSRWLLESVRAIMYRQKLLIRFFLDEAELHSLTHSLQQTQAICTSLKEMKSISQDELSLFPEVELFLQDSFTSQDVIPVQDIITGLETCIALHNSLKPYHYHHQLYIVQNKLIQAERVNQEGLNASSTADQISRFQNNLGGLAHRAGRLNEAIDYYQQSLDGVSLPVCSLNLSLAYLDQNLGSNALSHITRCFNEIYTISDMKKRSNVNKFCAQVLASHCDEYKEAIRSNSKLKDLVSNLVGNEIR